MHIYGTAAPALHAWTLAVYAGPALAASDSRVLLVRWHIGDRCRDDEAGIRALALYASLLRQMHI